MILYCLSRPRKPRPEPNSDFSLLSLLTVGSLFWVTVLAAFLIWRA